METMVEQMENTAKMATKKKVTKKHTGVKKTMGSSKPHAARLEKPPRLKRRK